MMKPHRTSGRKGFMRMCRPDCAPHAAANLDLEVITTTASEEDRINMKVIFGVISAAHLSLICIDRHMGA